MLTARVKSTSHILNMSRIIILLLCWTSVVLCTLDISLAQFDGHVHITSDEDSNNNDWWKTAAFYQIYPRSFMDSNGDGIGDLRGITARMKYLSEDLGVTGFWMSPIFKSPMADFGYDISDYFTIQPEYGTMQDFTSLIAMAKQLGLKVILDFVPNHSSDENDWFLKSARREPGFEDFYVWHPGKPNPNNASRPLPPNNWVSIFRFSAWEWNEVRQEYYYHQFLSKQPDLNYRNPLVVETMKGVLRYWLDHGVDGFRIDACPYLFEVLPDSEGNYPDEPLSGNTNDPDDYGYLKHIYTCDQNETIDMVYQWREVMDKYQMEHGGETRIIMTEAYSPIDVTMQYYGNATHNGAHMPFNFQLITSLSNDSSAFDFKAAVNAWMDHIPAEKTPNWVMGNHDQKRVSHRFGTDRVDIMNMILLTLPGVSVTYNGEEIGMVDVFISWADTKDPQACNTNPSVYDTVSRDPERTPFQWDNTTSAGFSTNPNTWLPMAPSYKDLNVERQTQAARSHLKVYQKLIQLRASNTLMHGSVVPIPMNNNVFIILRQLQNEDSLLTVVNLGDRQETVNLSMIMDLTNQLTYEIVGVSSAHEEGETITSSTLVLEPKESFVLRGSGANSQISSSLNFYNVIRI